MPSPSATSRCPVVMTRHQLDNLLLEQALEGMEHGVEDRSKNVGEAEREKAFDRRSVIIVTWPSLRSRAAISLVMGLTADQQDPGDGGGARRHRRPATSCPAPRAASRPAVERRLRD